jgi:hypothetical protein
VFWLQAGLSFFAWMLYGVVQWRRAHRLRAWVAGVSRSKRGLYGTLMIFGGAVVLLSGLLLVQAGDGLRDDRFEPWAWAVVTLLGLAFVHAQTMGAMLMIAAGSADVTSDPRPASPTKEPEDSND